MANYCSEVIVCPYYHRHDGNRIRCEGTNEDNSIHVVFGDQKKQKEYFEEFCYSIQGCRKCLIHQALDIKWQDK